MKKWVRNEKGITLVELLAALAIGAIVITIIGGIMTSVQKYYTEQAVQSKNLIDVTYAAKTITRDARKAADVSIDVGTVETLRLGSVTYTFLSSEEVIERNGVPIAKQIKEFHADYIDPQLSIEITGRNVKQWKSTITIRSGKSDEQ
ncbi:PilW family protein [Siminovitchia sediminis]|uniref:PilW family protein n=1 Tax=Siminovitchia sediminis TaxID=1274353 RepID=A0ABW4KL94_9BACI